MKIPKVLICIDGVLAAWAWPCGAWVKSWMPACAGMTGWWSG